MPNIKKITPFLWFNDNAEEAANYYVSIFKNSKITQIVRYGTAGQEQHKRPPGSVMVATFELEGQAFTALNGGPVFQFTPAISFVIMCDDQAELDHYWDKLSAGGDPKAQQCGWLKDKFGVSWQVIPSAIPRMMSDPDPKKSGRVMAAMMPMKKIDIATLEKAFEG